MNLTLVDFPLTNEPGWLPDIFEGVHIGLWLIQSRR
jgi:hypothetical protein